MKKIFDVLLLRGMWKFKPVHVILLWLAIGAYGWLASPYFMYHVVGAPKPGTAPRYTGTLHSDGQLSIGNRGLTPPRYFVRTTNGDVDVHCGYLPNKVECFWGTALSDGPLQAEVGYWPYWGVDHFRLGPPYEHLSDYGTPQSIREAWLFLLTYKSLKWDLVKFCLFAGLYVLLILIYLVPKSWIREMQGPSVPTEADIAAQIEKENALKQLATESNLDKSTRKAPQKQSHKLK